MVPSAVVELVVHQTSAVVRMAVSTLENLSAVLSAAILSVVEPCTSSALPFASALPLAEVLISVDLDLEALLFAAPPEVCSMVLLSIDRYL